MMMSIQGKMTASLKRHLITGRPPVIPAGGDLLWTWFADLNATRTWHMSGPNPISFAEIEAYARMMREPLEPRHVAVIREMDRIWIATVSKRKDNAAPGVKVLGHRSQQALLPSLFDTIMS